MSFLDLWELGFVALAVIERILYKFRVSPSAIAGYLLFGLSIALPGLWAMSREHLGSGVPPNFYTDTYSGLGAASFVVAASGFMSGSIAMRVKYRSSKNGFMQKPGIPFSRTLSLTVLGLYLLGQGPSILARDEYLRSDGVTFLLVALAFLGPLAGFGISAISVYLSQELTLGTFALAFTWYVASLSVGSRVSLLFPVALFLYFLSKHFSRTKSVALSILKFLPAGYFAIYLLQASFWVTNVSRASSRHGLLLLPKILSAPDSPSLLSPMRWLDTTLSAAASVCGSFPITELSAESYIDPWVLVKNANPLPSGYLDLQQTGQEFLLPWLPKSFLGEMTAGFGIVGTFILFFAVGVLSNYVYSRYASTGRRDLSVVILLITVAFAFLSTQYPSRVSLRIASLLYLIPFTVWLVQKIKSLLISPKDIQLTSTVQSSIVE